MSLIGQYHLPVNLDKREFIHPHQMGDGLKLLEWGASGYGTAAALGFLLGPEGRWAGDRIAVIGDYSEPGDLPEGIEKEVAAADAIYNGCMAAEYGREDGDVDSPEMTDLSEQAGRLLVGMKVWTGMPEGDGWSSRQANVDGYAPNGPECLLVNLDKAEAVDPAQLGDSRCIGSWAVDHALGTMTALVALTACANGRGGGDFPTSAEGDRLIGSWAGDHIAALPFDSRLDDVRLIGDEVRDLFSGWRGVSFLVTSNGDVTRDRW